MFNHATFTRTVSGMVLANEAARIARLSKLVDAHTGPAPVAEDRGHYDTVRDLVPTDLDHVDPRDLA
jgi:hypothetical protein